MDNFGQNPFQPGMRSSLFVPDQLVAGPLQLVTDTVVIVQAEVIHLRGTVMGKITASGEYIKSVKDATDGSEVPVAILVDNVDTTVTAQRGGIYLMGQFNQNRIVHDASWTLAELKTALRPYTIFLTDSIQAPV
ncbi:head decoration protein [Yersinia frederiksenii]|uniref:head decoration protein n=1 Tax=Yersinia frederiksenii TaxID=29484 RepID=UPI000B6A8A78|nr:head decoration protein [Yersinia frederiksenii]OWF77693.1 head decoration protein [Yersinia kristensenii]